MKKKLLLAALLGCANAVFAQPTYYMSDQQVDDCEAYLYDSEAGDPMGNYDHNEDLTFTICVPGASTITLNFFSFCTEGVFDVLQFFDGPNTTSPQIGPDYSGDVDIPPVVAASGCLTLHFTSDANVSCTGWYAFWSADIEEPLPPDILPIPNLPCESSALTLTLADPVACDSIYPGAFSISGAQAPTVLTAVPLNCNNGLATMVALTFDPPIDFSGNYEVHFTNSYVFCEEIFFLESTEAFSVVDCPLNVELVLDGTIVCVGQTGLLIAETSGGNPASYTYTWNPLVSFSQFAVVTPNGPTTYMVTVTDTNGAMASDTLTITPFPLPVITPGDTTACATGDPFALNALPTGGVWSGTAITDSMAGIFDPAQAGGMDAAIFYTDPNGCSSSAEVGIIPFSAGPDEAACPNAPAFSVGGFFPAGGSWSGPFISPGGLFSPPPTGGDYLVVYTHPNGCSDEKTISVDSILLPALDTICESIPAFLLGATPANGLWMGPGVTNGATGAFNPAQANAGNNQLVYSVNGCQETLDLFLVAIDALWDLSACPTQAPFLLPGAWTPMGVGTWSGAGIADPLTGLYDPGLVPTWFNDTLTLTAGGCTDRRIVYVLPTTVGLTSLDFCPTDSILELNYENTMRIPWGGAWTGAGVFNTTPWDYFFDPSQPSPGTYTLTYTANTCSDTMQVTVHPIPAINAPSLCVANSPVNLQANPPGGTWAGTGIVNASIGLFNPGLAGVGDHLITYTSPAGCTAQATLTVTPLLDPEISGLEAFYCFQNQTFFPILTPPGGIFTIDGTTTAGFNPALAGQGFHTLEYTVGVGECQSTAVWIVEVGQPLTVTLPFTLDSICYGDNIQLSAQAGGGNTLLDYTYTWSQGLGFGQVQLVQPFAFTTYTVTVADGCSDPVQGSLSVFVHPQITADYFTGPKVCAEDTTFAEVFAQPAGDYTFTWDSDPPFQGTVLEDTPGFFSVEVLNDQTSCSIGIEVELPGWDPVRANFGLSPNQPCVTTGNPVVQVLDFSAGGSQGYWDFGDGLGVVPYQLGQSLNYAYRDTGQYTIRLFIENEGGCWSSFERQICVEYASALYAPNALTPNADGVNDVFRFVGFEVTELEYRIFNRYGELMFEASGLEASWDGTYLGRRVQSGVYVVEAKYRTLKDPSWQGYQGFITVLY